MPEDSEEIIDRSLRKIAKGGGILFLGSILGMAIGYLSRPIIARMLGPSPYGQVSLAFAGLSIAAVIGAFGLPGGLVRYVSLFLGKDEREKVKGVLISGLKIAIPTGILSGIFLYFSSGWLAVHLFHTPSITPLLKIMSIGVPFTVLMKVLLGGVRGFQQMRYQVYTKRLVHPISRTLLIAVLVFLGFGVRGAAFGYILSAALASFVALYFLHRKLFPFLRSNINTTSMRWELFSYSWPLLLSGIMMLVTQWTDVLMLGFFMTTTDVGFYNAALPTAMMFSAVPIAVGMIFFPVLSELYGKDREGEMEEIFTTTTKWVFFILLPMALLMVLFSGAVLKIIFGPLYVVASTALSILTVGSFVYHISATSRQMIKIVGRTKFIALISGVTAGSNVALNYLLIPVYGITGAGLGTGASFVAGGIIAWALTFRVTGWSPFNTDYLKGLTSGLTAAGVTFVVYQTVSSFLRRSIPLLGGMFIVFILIYFFMLLLLRSFDKNDLMIIKSIERKAGLRLKFLRKLIKELGG